MLKPFTGKRFGAKIFFREPLPVIVFSFKNSFQSFFSVRQVRWHGDFYEYIDSAGSFYQTALPSTLGLFVSLR
jgi:hypothetical protein